MNISKIIFFLCFLLVNLNFGQDIVRVTPSTSVPALLSNISIDAFNSMGFSNITKSQISEIGSSNPATLDNFDGIASGIIFQYNTKSDYFAGVKLERAKQWLPSGFGIVYPKNNLRFGLSYHQKYSNRLDFGRIEETTEEYPDGTGEFYEPSSELVVHSPSILISYSITDMIFVNDKLILGSQLFWDFWKFEEKILKPTAFINTSDFSWKIGLKYDFKTALAFGLLFEKGIDMEGEVKPKLEFAVPFSPEADFGVMSSEKYIQKFKLPDKLSFGFHNQILNNVLLSSNLTLVFWNSLDKVYEDQLDFSAATQIIFTDNISSVFGLYFTDRKHEEKNRYFGNPYHATFYNIGLKAEYENISFIAEFLNTTKSSAEYRKQSIYKLNLNYNFNN